MTDRRINDRFSSYCDYPNCWKVAFRRILEGSPFAFWGRLGTYIYADLCKEHYFQYYQTMKEFFAKETKA